MKIYFILLGILCIWPATGMDRPSRKRAHYQEPSGQSSKVSRLEGTTPMLVDQEEHNRILHTIVRWGTFFRSYCKSKDCVQGQ